MTTTELEELERLAKQNNIAMESDEVLELIQSHRELVEALKTAQRHLDGVRIRISAVDNALARAGVEI